MTRKPRQSASRRPDDPACRDGTENDFPALIRHLVEAAGGVKKVNEAYFTAAGRGEGEHDYRDLFRDVMNGRRLGPPNVYNLGDFFNGFLHWCSGPSFFVAADLWEQFVGTTSHLAIDRQLAIAELRHDIYLSVSVHPFDDEKLTSERTLGACACYMPPDEMARCLQAARPLMASVLVAQDEKHDGSLTEAFMERTKIRQRLRWHENDVLAHREAYRAFRQTGSLPDDVHEEVALAYSIARDKSLWPATRTYGVLRQFSLLKYEPEGYGFTGTTNLDRTRRELFGDIELPGRADSGNGRS